MALYTYHHDAPRIVRAAREWADRCLVQDGSIFSDARISTLQNFNALDSWFVQRPDEGAGGFYDKLRAQLAPAPSEARKLMAELLWALFLFPSNVSKETKRDGIVQVWSSSGDALDPAHPQLVDAVLDGIGSAGMGVNSNRWRELNFMVAIGQSLKAMSMDSREVVLGDYDRFMDWIASVPQDGNRQFRHMLRYMLFPLRVERMSSNGDRMKVLAAYGVAKPRDMKKWSDRQFDDAMLSLRRAQKEIHGTEDLDFYLEPLRDRWKEPNTPDVEIDSDEETALQVNDLAPGSYATAGRKPRNLILYGPPGTGKTWRLQQMFDAYTDQAADIDRSAWLQQLVAPFGWRAVIAVALAGIGTPSKAGAVEAHELIEAKARQRQRDRHIRSAVWGYMQSHTSPDCEHVNVADKRPPYVFTKDAASNWSLLPQWQEIDPEAAELFAAWQAGQQDMGGPLRRYRVVTFHPSYSYEDFVIGLRPVTQDGSNATAFRMVDGVFKQICADARANPVKRHALFIDEINRANIAKVFGELITLIEVDKRARYDESGARVAGMEVQLPGTGGEEGNDERFGVPENLDIIGTMNTADRSIALLDIALRRRFEFEEIPPEYGVLDRRVEGVDLGRMLRAINDRIEFLADRDRRIGHAYFTRVASLDDLRASFRRQVIPLLQEFFFDDWGRIALVLSARNGRSAFVRREILDGGKLFGNASEVQQSERFRHEVTAESDWTAEAFQSIYEDVAVLEPAVE